MPMTDEQLMTWRDHSVTTNSTTLPVANRWDTERGNPRADFAEMPIGFPVRRLVAHPLTLHLLPWVPMLEGAEVIARDVMGGDVLLFGDDEQRYLIANVIEAPTSGAATTTKELA